MASELRVNTLKDAAGNNSIATSFVANGSAKAWCKFGPDGQPDDSFNIASGTDIAVGQWRFAKTNAMSNANYAMTSASGRVIAAFVTGEDSAAIESTANHAHSKYSETNGFADFAGDGYGMHTIHGALA
tara:strand:+ start:363 stop:749 length:387 start_codon:yes stop_codon:yes gene_type:complete